LADYLYSITLQNQHPHDVVRLAQLTEQAGLDLVTFMDHPCNPGFFDTWTLLSYVAAKTERVRLSGYVLSSAFLTLRHS
jgi:alkanesulfonate monooxygenase SsuD/methylene tetrahydromethanopterin reductase-like flavin-dependent oxidoreductase (luciferase family)